MEIIKVLTFIQSLASPGDSALPIDKLKRVPHSGLDENKIDDVIDGLALKGYLTKHGDTIILTHKGKSAITSL
ncbi:MAG: hypothetical protein EOP56_03495 [Sphingobacteriales bacterium]|nr:MAG: hypothetical protein EOP56_03495 [Sphingobacteriales bacterium]